MTDQIAHTIWILMALVLVGSSLALRRMPRGKLVSTTLIWIAIFGAVWFAVYYYSICCAAPR